MRAILAAVILALIGLASGWRSVVARRRRTIYVTPRTSRAARNVLAPQEPEPTAHGDIPHFPPRLM